MTVAVPPAREVEKSIADARHRRQRGFSGVESRRSAAPFSGVCRESRVMVEMKP